MAKLIDGVGEKSAVYSVNQVYTLDTQQLLARLTKKDCNKIFFCGAGFSKAWDDSYPTGMELFAIDTAKSLEQNFFKFADDLEITRPQKGDDEQDYNQACYDYFRAIKFHLDSYKRYPSLMPSYIDLTTITALESEIRDFVKARFVGMVDKDGTKGELELEHPIDNQFTQFFNQLFKVNNAAISFITTNYDFIIEKIIHNTDGDVSLNRGVVDRTKFKDKSWHPAKINLFKLNGGFEISCDEKGSYIDYDKHQTHPDNIILPSPQQNYNDPYFDSVFVKSASKLREANLLIFIGYSLPEEDHTIRFLLKNFNDADKTQKEIVVIGRNAKSAQGVANIAKSIFVDLGKKGGIFAFDGSLNDLLTAEFAGRHITK